MCTSYFKENFIQYWNEVGCDDLLTQFTESDIDLMANNCIIPEKLQMFIELSDKVDERLSNSNDSIITFNTNVWRLPEGVSLGIILSAKKYKKGLNDYAMFTALLNNGKTVNIKFSLFPNRHDVVYKYFSSTYDELDLNDLTNSVFIIDVKNKIQNNETVFSNIVRFRLFSDEECEAYLHIMEVYYENIQEGGDA